MVVVTVIAVLIGLALPALRAAKVRAEETQSLARVNQCAGLLFSSAADNGDAIPTTITPARFGMSAQGMAVEIDIPNSVVIGTDYFAQTSIWPALLLAVGYEPSEAWLSPSRREPPQRVYSTDFDLTHSVLAGPEHWRDPTTQRSSMWRRVRLSEASYAPLKALLVERASSAASRDRTADPEVAVSCVDGHARLARRGDASEPVANSYFNNAALPMLTTREGLSGSDFQ